MNKVAGTTEDNLARINEWFDSPDEADRREAYYEFTKFLEGIASTTNDLLDAVGYSTVKFERCDTGGGCQAVCATDGVTDVVLSCEGEGYDIGTYRTSEEHPESGMWYPEQSINHDEHDRPMYFVDTTTLGEVAEVLAGLAYEFITEENPFYVHAEGYPPVGSRTNWGETVHAAKVDTIEDALDLASNLSFWADGEDGTKVRHVTIADCRSGQNVGIKFNSHESAMALYGVAIGRGGYDEVDAAINSGDIDGWL